MKTRKPTRLEVMCEEGEQIKQQILMKTQYFTLQGKPEKYPATYQIFPVEQYFRNKVN